MYVTYAFVLLRKQVFWFKGQPYRALHHNEDGSCIAQKCDDDTERTFNKDQCVEIRD